MPFTQSAISHRLARRLYRDVPLLRDLFASAWGYRLHAIRYGPETDPIAEEALGREQWSRERWRLWQEERLAELLHHAATKVPYYRTMWQRRRAAGDSRSWDRLENWPVLEKAEIRAHGSQMIADGVPRESLMKETTSGSTGSPLPFWFPQDTVRTWYALSEARWRNWNHLARGERWAMLGAQIVVPQSQTVPPYWVSNLGLNQLYLSSYHLSDETANLYADALARFQVKYIWGLSSALHRLATELIRRKRRDLRMAVALTSSEPLLKSQAAAISEAFQCEVRETYGMSEMAAAASECQWGSLHMWPEVAHCEAVDGGDPVAPGDFGELLATPLINPAMPLIRYRVGDLVRFAPDDYQCGCGRTLPVLDEVVGRVGDLLHGSDGRRIPPSSMEAIFDADLRIVEGQIVQEDVSRIRVLYVPGDGCSLTDLHLMRDRVQERLGPVQVDFERCESIPRRANGKLQAVRCAIGSQAAALRRTGV